MIHVIIKTERRQPPRRLAIQINNDLRTENGTESRPPQLHMLASRITDSSNISYAAEWDGNSPWITASIGAIADLKMAYMGWPMVTKEEWAALNPPRTEP